MPKITQPKYPYIVGLCVAVIIGVVIGKIWTDIPIIKFDGTINVGSIISFLSLIAAIFIIPFMINNYFARRSHTGAMVQSDIDEAIKKCESVAEQYRDIHFSNVAVKQNDTKLLRMRFRDILNILTTISDNSSSLPEFKDFRVKVQDKFNTTAYVDFTDTAMVGKKITDDQFFAATKSMTNVITLLRRYRYRIS